MPALVPYTQAQIDSFKIVERGVRDGTSPSEMHDGISSTCVRRVFCDWESRFEVLRYFFGDVDTYAAGDAGEVGLSRLLPQRHPVHQEWIAVKLAEPIRGWKFKDYGLAVGAEDDPPEDRYPWDGRSNAFHRAELAVQYEHVSFRVAADDEIGSELDRYVTYQPGEGSEVELTQPTGTMKYLVPGATAAMTPPPHLLPVPYGVPYAIPEETFYLKWQRVAEAALEPGSTLFNRIYRGEVEDGFTVPYLGCVNGLPFYGLDPGTVKFKGAERTLLRSPLGVGWEWAVKYKFLYRPQGFLSLRFFPPVTGTIPASAGGLYFVGTEAAVPAVLADTPDYAALACVRDLNRLFVLGV